MSAYAVAAYRESLERLRDAQARYEMNRDDRASDHLLSAAIKDVLIARADLERIRRQHPSIGAEGLDSFSAVVDGFAY